MNYRFLTEIDNTWTLFLDRDGVINRRKFGGYITKPSEFEFLPGVLDSLSFFTSIFNIIIIITNQQGIAKGIMSEDELIDLHKYMNGEIVKNNGNIDAIYYCTDLSDAYNNCRKPSIKMAQKAKNDFPAIDFTKSIMVGDSISDIEFGNNSGMKTIFITNNKNVTNIATINIDNLSELKILIQSL